MGLVIIHGVNVNIYALRVDDYFQDIILVFFDYLLTTDITPQPL